MANKPTQKSRAQKPEEGNSVSFDEVVRRMLSTPPQPKKAAPTTRKKRGK